MRRNPLPGGTDSSGTDEASVKRWRGRLHFLTQAVLVLGAALPPVLALALPLALPSDLACAADDDEEAPEPPGEPTLVQRPRGVFSV